MKASLLKSYRFRDEREEDWRKLEAILKRAEGMGGLARLSDQDMIDLTRLYRQAVSSLSVARSISLDRNVVEYLEGLCARAYFFVYGPRTRFGRGLSRFFRESWPNAMQTSGVPMLLSAACFLGAWALAFTLCMIDMDWFWVFDQASLFDTRTPNADTSALRDTLYNDPANNEGFIARLAHFAGYLFNNNAQIAILAFALGFMFGIPTAILLILNGLTLGAFYALFWSRGLGYEVSGWLFIHGATELLGIIVAGAAGFRIGGAVAFPGQKSRLTSAREEGQAAGIMAGGVVIMMFIAGLLESFGRELINSDVIRYAIAVTTFALWMAYFFLPRKSGISS